MTIAITGAFSYSGKYITRRLLERGQEVITLTGHPERPDPFEGRVKVRPLDFQDQTKLLDSLRGVDTFFNTYWVRFDRGRNTQPAAVENTRRLVQAAAEAGVRRIVHISITNPSADSPLPYFSGKAANEQSVVTSGMSYAILRPTVLFGREDILINNIAWLLRRFPFFALPGDGRYCLQPAYVDDLAALAIEAADRPENLVWDVVGPENLSFREMVEMIGTKIGHPRPLVPVDPRLALAAARLISIFVGDVVLTREEVQGLMQNLLVSQEPPRGTTRLSDWLRANRDQVGREYASELKRHF
ncbi:MAG: SDR family oxidoreductase [Bacteroidota bacterium]